MKRNHTPPIVSLVATAAAVGAAFFLSSDQSASASGGRPAGHPAAPAPAAKRPQKTATSIAYTPAAFPYKGTQFNQFVQTSYAGGPKGTPDFYAFMDRAYQRSGVRFKGHEKDATLSVLLANLNKQYKATTDPARRAAMEKQTGAFAFRLMKKTIPKFSLDRGFEFYSAVRTGERQCYLQSIIVSGMLQAAGMNAGVAMVSRNEHGQPTNNGHAIALVKGSDGRDFIVDVSDKVPFARQQGLMTVDTATGNYRYVAPRYDSHSATITGYDAYEGEQNLSTRAVAGLPTPFLVSQFDYYRGERAPNGFVAKTKTDAGLEASAKYLRRAVEEDPRNPLAQYVLGRVYLRQNKKEEARQQLATAYRLYDRFGFVPSGPRDALALVGTTPQAVAVASR